ncbi:hypothetical protein [Methylobacterium marchantiae]|uniref:Secreted protein n=1 Tax=Methylobacterium marchantiae TaxID=600331 RepID=A0ABW3X361_9HYPH|nr:hypothetical protein AIGOOFII_4189 [Methylobacterium marchantiae]
MRSFLLATTALFAFIPSVFAIDSARRRVIEEACCPYEREEKGPNGVMSPREVRCRLSMGESYAEIDEDITVLQTMQAEQQRLDEKSRAQALERASRERDTALQSAPGLCRRMVQEHKEGR